jgi:hypothetical protein
MASIKGVKHKMGYAPVHFNFRTKEFFEYEAVILL